MPLRTWVASCLTLAAVFTAPSAALAAQAQIKVLSNRADVISGGDALVQVDPPGARVDVDGRDVTPAFAVRPDGRYLGIVAGLAEGDNVLTARAPGVGGARLTITNHPTGGPVFAGPQIQPWTCFPDAVDTQCNRPPRYEYVYKSTGGGPFQAYDPENPPGDVGETTTDQGKTVPYIVRVETGSIDRDEYRIAILYDPSKPWAPWAPQDGFNHKMLITHGASCDTAYTQAEAPDVLNETALSRGFVVMSNALDNSGHNCNVAVQAEALLMTKERAIEQYGELRYTIGTGASGGALAQYQVSNAYPGIYQGITPGASFPDTWSGRMLYEDYSLLRRYFENPSRWEPGVAWEDTSITSVLGHPNYANTVVYNTAIAPLLDPSRSCPGLESSKVYNAQSNPKGVRCSLQDYMVAIFGRRAQDGFAGRPWDNTGVEYGRKALIAGKITPSQFADVNAKVGGRDIDYEPQPARAVADRPALERAYRSGAVDQGTHLDKVAIIDLRGPDPGAFHDVYRTYALRARLVREHGTAANQLLWRGPIPLAGDAGFTEDAIVAMDEWLAAVEKDPRAIPLSQKILEDKPESIGDRCTNGSGEDRPNDECNATVQSYTTARIEAGMPFTDDVIKCDLKPLRRTDYLPVQFSEREWEKLQETFPNGVCDYRTWGVDRVKTVDWQTYEDGPGGEPLGAPPASAPLSTPLVTLGLPSSRRCVSRRRFRIRLRSPRGDRLTSARVYVNGRRVRVLRGRRLTAPVNLRGLPKGKVRVRIVGRTRGGKRIARVRTYRTCTPKRSKRRPRP
jgi:hypothetical protein